jgi:hypothetical protein
VVKTAFERAGAYGLLHRSGGGEIGEEHPSGAKAQRFHFGKYGTAEAVPFQDSDSRRVFQQVPSMVSLKFVASRRKEQPQILRLRLAKKRPNYAQDDKRIYVANFRDRALEFIS